jgi:exodeoxyribonuclease III
MISILSYNVNGIRAAIGKGFWDWMHTHQFDVVCLQETKALQSDVPVLELEAMGYQHFWHSAEKKGYSSVAIFSKKTPDKVVYGCGNEKYDREGRFIRADFGDWSVLNCYFPSGTTGDVRQDFKMEMLKDFSIWIAELKKERPNLIIVGDYNIANHPIDIHDPKGNKNSSGFLPDERAWLSNWFENEGFTDAFRYKHPEMVEYSWWSYRAGARGNNKGWRIDYQSVADTIKDKIVDCRQMNEVMHSDHCPVILKIDLD